MTIVEGPVTIGIRVPYEVQRDLAALRSFVRQADDAGIDRLCVGDHVTFKGGQGFDGLQNATAVAVLSDRVVVQTAVYLLPLRHPVPVARQLATLATLAPGRISFGVGVGGDDPDEFRACGLDPASRGRRMDEALAILRSLLAGDAVTSRGPHYPLEDVRVLPAPPVAVPLLVGGRSEAAVRRTARSGDGWLGLWVSPRRFAEAVGQIAALAADAGREVTTWHHGMHVWCGIGENRTAARARLAGEMESLYRVDFAKFEKYSPYGSPADIAESLAPYVRAGSREVNLIMTAPRPADAIEAAREVRELLAGELR